MPRGGYRENAGRKSRGIPTSKVTVYQCDRDAINQYAKSLSISANELIYRLIRHSEFEKIIKDLEQSSK